MPPVLTATNRLPDDVDVVAIPVAQGADGPELTGDGHGLDLDDLRARGFEGKVGETATAAVDGTTYLAVGVGRADDVTAEVLRRAASCIVRGAWKRSSAATTLLDAAPGDIDRGAAGQAIAEGVLLGAYRFTRFKSDPDECRLESVTVVGSGGRKLAGGIERATVIAGAVALARDLVNTPAGSLTPVDFAKAATEAAGAAGLEAEVFDDKQAAKLGLGGITGVGRGSDNPPRLVKLTYEPTGTARGTLALVGKGITFDSGGLSIKPADGMMTMKTDMSGAAAVLGAMTVLPVLQPRVRVVGYLCLAENMPSGRAIRPGDVLTIRNGTTVEVLNTDAEGRLVLADGLSLATEDGADAVVDLATLTGACMVALGPKIAGLMANHEQLAEQIEAAADRTGEQVWRLPLPDEYDKQLDSEVADVKNIGNGRYGGALTAGLFLRRFVGDTPWAHLDIAGPARFEEDDAYVPKGGTGFGVRTVVETITSFRKPR